MEEEANKLEIETITAVVCNMEQMWDLQCGVEMFYLWPHLAFNTSSLISLYSLKAFRYF
jgi:hypothetical protein